MNTNSTMFHVLRCTGHAGPYNTHQNKCQQQAECFHLTQDHPQKGHKESFITTCHISDCGVYIISTTDNTITYIQSQIWTALHT